MILVGPPGIGKSDAISSAEEILRTVPEIHVAPTDVTTASLIDALDAANRKILRPEHSLDFMQFNYVTVCASELGNFLPAYEPTFINFLQKVYDGEFYEQARRTAKKTNIRLERAQINFLGGTTPGYLNSFLPSGAWDQGFTARTIFVHHGAETKTDIFPERDVSGRIEQLHQNLNSDLKEISSLVGMMHWDQHAMEGISEWYRDGLRPVPDHPRLAHYNTRRLAHTIKLSCIASISRSSDFTIAAADFAQARDWLVEAEDTVPDIFSARGIAGDAQAIDECYHFVYKLYMKDKKPVLEGRVVNFLKDKIPSYSIYKVIEVMSRSGLLLLESLNGLNAYKPGIKN